jgi:hypothetical protein
MKNMCQWIIGFCLCAYVVIAHPAQFHEKVTGKQVTGKIQEVSPTSITLHSGRYILGENMKVTQVEYLKSPAVLEEFAFVSYQGGELTKLPDWFPEAFGIGDTTAAGVLRRSRQNPDHHFIQANRRMFRLPLEGVSSVKCHHELKALPELKLNQKILIITGTDGEETIVKAICLFPVTKD